MTQKEIIDFFNSKVKPEDTRFYTNSFLINALKTTNVRRGTNKLFMAGFLEGIEIVKGNSSTEKAYRLPMDSNNVKTTHIKRSKYKYIR